MENSGRFEGEQIEQLKRLGGWAEKSQVVHLYIKRIVEEYSDTCGLLLRSVNDARTLYLTWHKHAYPGKAVVFPLEENDIKAFTIALSEAGFSFPRIMNNLYKGLCMWQIGNNQDSPGRMYPELGGTIAKFLRKEIGDKVILGKDPMFKQDYEHLLDVIGINNDADLQLSFIHAMSAHCGARLSSLAQPVIPSSITRIREDMGLEPYADPTGMLVGDVKFRWDEELGLSMKVVMTHEKNDAANRAHRREYTFTPLEKGSPYCTAVLGFLLLAKRGAFARDPLDAWEHKEFRIWSTAETWPLLCAVDTSTQTLTNKPMTTAMMARAVKRSICKAGFDEVNLSHRSYRSANPLPHGLDKIPDVQGYLVLNSDGAVLASSGDLENEENIAASITKMLQTAAKIPISGDRTQTFKRMSVYYRDFTLMATVSNQKIYIVKRPLKQESD